MGVGPGHVDRKRRESVDDPAGSAHHPLGSFDQRERKPDATTAHTGPDPGDARVVSAGRGEKDENGEKEKAHRWSEFGFRDSGSERELTRTPKTEILRPS